MQDNWTNSLPYLHQARADAQRAVERLEKVSEALRLFRTANESAQVILARQLPRIHRKTIGQRPLRNNRN